MLGNSEEDTKCGYNLVETSIVRKQVNLFCNKGEKVAKRSVFQEKILKMLTISLVN